MEVSVPTDIALKPGNILNKKDIITIKNLSKNLFLKYRLNEYKIKTNEYIDIKRSILN